MQRKEVERIVTRAYPKIVQDLGIGKRGVPPVEVHKDIYARLSGDPEAMGEDSKTSEAEYDWDNNRIYIYYPNMKNEEDVLRSLLHEHTHTLQDHRKEKKYREMGYEKNPHEIESRKAEKNWKKYKNMKQIKEYNTFITEATQEEIQQTIDIWLQTVKAGDPQAIADLYAEDGVLLGTVAENIKQGRQVIKTYFDMFVKKNPSGVIDSIIFQEFGDTAVADGNYTFSLDNEDGSRDQVPARFTFVIHNNDGVWEIQTHHSSVTPEN